MSSIKLTRLNESHEMDLPQELLSMTVQDMLDRIESIDTLGDAEYEIIELALNTLATDIINSGYERSQDLSIERSVEGSDSEEEIDFSDSGLEDDMPNFSDIDSRSMSNDRPNDSFEDFQF